MLPVIMEKRKIACAITEQRQIACVIMENKTDSKCYHDYQKPLYLRAQFLGSGK